MTDLAVEAPTPVRSKLDRALVDYLGSIGEEQDLDEVNIETVARAAGVSRATAYRHFGDRDGLLSRAVIEISRRNAHELAQRQASLPTVAAKIEEAFAFMAASLRQDRVIMHVVAPHQSEEMARAFNALSMELVAPMYRAAQADGQLRDDLTVEEIIAWLNEQRQVVVGLGLSEEDTRVWVRKFVLPALRPQQVAQVSRSEVQAVLSEFEQRVNALAEVMASTLSKLT
ncbi:MAG: putative transcriptional regulator, TetR family [Frankiales bacterium]|nr:putative transcriptional regulator, TetR family [Frankiales bacterium]